MKNLITLVSVIGILSAAVVASAQDHHHDKDWKIKQVREALKKNEWNLKDELSHHNMRAAKFTRHMIEQEKMQIRDWERAHPH